MAWAWCAASRRPSSRAAASMLRATIRSTPSLLLERSAQDWHPAQEDPLDVAGRGDVLERVAADQEQIGDLSLFDGAELRAGIEEAGGAAGGAEQDFSGRKPGRDLQLQLVVIAAGEGGDRPLRVVAGQHRHARGVQLDEISRPLVAIFFQLVGPADERGLLQRGPLFAQLLVGELGQERGGLALALDGRALVMPRGQLVEALEVHQGRLDEDAPSGELPPPLLPYPRRL